MPVWQGIYLRLVGREEKLIELIFLFLYLFGIKNIILLIAAVSIALHWLIDFLTVHTPLTLEGPDRTFHLINDRIFDSLKNECVARIEPKRID